MNEIVPVRTIGGYVPMVDGPEKVSGRAKYTADLHRAGNARRRASSAAPIRTPKSSTSMFPRRRSCRA